MRTYDNIIVHCSDSEWGDRAIIDEWHKQRKFNEIGYHFVLLNGKINTKLNIEALNGSIEIGRDVKRSGAHCVGYNNNSLGICLIGKLNFTEKQIIKVVKLITDLMYLYSIPLKNVLGHCETPKANGKTCPNINVSILRDMIKKYQSGDSVWLSEYNSLFSCSF